MRRDTQTLTPRDAALFEPHHGPEPDRRGDGEDVEPFHMPGDADGPLVGLWRRMRGGDAA